MSIRGVGIDIADPQRFAQLVERSGHTFLRRWFTPEEVAQCQAQRQGGSRAFAARYAAKEAVWKALGPDGWRGPLPWRDIAILDGAGPGRNEVFLSGAVAELALRVGVASVEVSLCPGAPDGPAIAIAVAGA
jgi:phosphopantetheine--protein transferase-like protein